jgi:UPF0271 protein
VKRIDLNVDVAEGFPHDRALMKFASSLNICCGVHAGSPDITQETIQLALDYGKRWGLHPGYPDPTSMGRTPITLENARSYLESIFIQVRRWVDFAPPAYLKPHGAFYNDTAVKMPAGWEHPPKHEETGIYLNAFPGVHSLGMLLRLHRLPLLGLPGTAHVIVAARSGQGCFLEGFADRAYRSDGTLMPRNQPGAILQDLRTIRTQVRMLATQVDSICLHGDTENCVEIAETVYAALTDAGFEVSAR